MPTREMFTSKDYTLVADLDAFIREPIAFKFGGKAYEISPVRTEDFMKMARSLDKVQKLLEQRKDGIDITDESITDAYHSLFAPLCPALSLEDVRQMTVAQLHAILQLFIRHLTGQELAPEKKNPPLAPANPNLPQLLLQKARTLLDSISSRWWHF